jgi:hypothetical protein
MYAADVYGNIWKITYNYFAETEAVAMTLSKRWKVKRIFASNPGSDMPSGDPVISSGLKPEQFGCGQEDLLFSRRLPLRQRVDH